MRINKLLFLLFLLPAVLMSVTACSDDKDDESEFSDWKNRNDAYFANIRACALDTISRARATYGSEWEANCQWRTYLSYSLDETIENASTDSIYIRILKRGNGQESPMGSDSCRIFYQGRLIPTASHATGYVFAYSGQSSIYEDIFDPTIATPSTRKATSYVRGLATALMRMHVGDRWRIYIPYPLGYKDSNDNESIPAYSTLICEVELVAFYRNGSKVPSWN